MTHCKESHKGVRVVTSLRMCTSRRLIQSALTPPWPLIVNLEPELNRTQREQNKWTHSVWPVAVLWRLLQLSDGEASRRGAGNVCGRARYCPNVEPPPRNCAQQTLLLSADSPLFLVGALHCRTQQMKALVIWWSSVCSCKAAEERETLT